jgi:large subunit ribosomal protein L21
MKYAVVETGGKQYMAREGEAIEVDRLHLEVGTSLDLTDVLLLVNGDKVKVGKPYVKGAKVVAKVAEHFKGRKILVFKYIPKERYRRRKGHRQQYTRLEIEKIQATSRAKSAKVEEQPAEAPAAS